MIVSRKVIKPKKPKCWGQHKWTRLGGIEYCETCGIARVASEAKK